MKKPGRKTERKKPKSSVPTVDIKDDTDDDFHLSKTQLRELDRRIADSKDPVRYLIEGGFGPKFRLYYNVTDDVYAMNNPAGATLFKRRKAALAVQKLLGARTRLLRCTTRRRMGQLIPVLPMKKSTAKGGRVPRVK